MERPPYRWAAGMSLVVLLGYCITLAPTVTFWDAGEFITAARTLGIPHPPGSPLFVLLTNVWGRLVPFGEYAWRINFFSAVCTAAAGGCWFLVVHDVIGRMHAEIDDSSRAAFARFGGAAAALLTSFSFTVWQSATETEVYATTTLSVALVAWCVTRWRVRRADPAGSRLLLAALYLGALSVGNHLMGLLVGPALIAGLALEARRAPLFDAVAQRGEWTRIATIAAAWLLLIGIGLGNALLGVTGGLALLLAAGDGVRTRQLRFAAGAALVVLVGVSTLVFLYLRARQHPWLNSGNPATWSNLVDVVRRAQYAPRTPFDDPTVMHGPGNPGRTFTLLAYQLANYAQYFDWQWASAFGELSRASIARLACTLLMLGLGLRGAFAQRDADRASFAFIAGLWFTAGPLLVLYLNFKPGSSIGWNLWLNGADHEVRDRDYFFVASFVAWGIWVAIGLVDVARRWIPRLSGQLRTAAVGVFGVALLPLAFNFTAATRRQTVEVVLARDFAHALLGSVPQDGVLFTYGDNDTFPLWFAQQVEGVRPDVTVICLALAQTGWYIRQFAALYDLPPDQVARPPFRMPRDLVLDLGVHGVATIRSGAAVYPFDILAIEILRKNVGHRPIAWSITAADQLYGLDASLIQQGLALVLPVVPVDPAALIGGPAAAPGGTPLDLAATRRLVDEWHFGALETRGPDGLDQNIRAVAGTIAIPIRQTGIALAMRGDTVAAVRLLQRAVRLADDSLARVVLGRLARAPSP